MSNSLNDCFISTTVRVNDSKLNIWNLDINHPMEYLHQTFKKLFLSIKLKYTSIRKFKKINTPLKPSNSNGYNEISTKILKAYAQFIISPSTYICSHSLSTGIFPSCLKYSIVNLLFKIHSFHRYVQNGMIPCHCQELLPFLSVMYFFLPPFSTNYSSILSHHILPSISWSTSQSCCSQIHI